MSIQIDARFSIFLKIFSTSQCCKIYTIMRLITPSERQKQQQNGRKMSRKKKRKKLICFPLTCCCPSCPPLFSQPIASAKSHWSCWSKAQLWTGQRHAKAHCPTRNQIIKKKIRSKLFTPAGTEPKRHTHARVWQARNADGWICRAPAASSSLASAVLCAGRRGSKYLLNDTHAVGPSAGLVGYATNQPTKGSTSKEIDEARIYTIPRVESYWNRGSRHLYLCEKGKQKWRAQKKVHFPPASAIF